MIKTKTGFCVEIDPETLNDMELIEELAKLETGTNAVKIAAISSVAAKLLGEEGKKALYEHVRNEKGRVPITAVERELVDIFSTLSNVEKN